MAFGLKKTVLPLAHGERISNALAAFKQAQDELEDTVLCIDEDINETQEKLDGLVSDRARASKAVSNIKALLG